MDEATARQYMELAVEKMRDSIAESRRDGKPLPKVGAVVVFPNGEVETAVRGELRDGEHAEYTLLERKVPARDLREAVLFSTLEPCADGARQPPKSACARRIIGARIKEVWIGIEDPYPTVAKQGMAQLRAAGVEVKMFDRDLWTAPGSVDTS